MPKDCKGFSEGQLLKAEKRLNITLPQMFREYYLQLGATKSVNQSFNSLATPQQLYFAGNYLCFCEENQGVVMWAIRKEDLTIFNPPVWGNYGSETDPDWVLETQTLSFEVPTGAVAHIEKQYTELTSLSWEGQRTFTDEDFKLVITLSIHRDTGKPTAIFIGTTQKALFDRLLNDLGSYGLQWDYTSYDD